MHIVANENISGTVIQKLRKRGHDVLSAKEAMRGAPDEDILARAQQENRLVLTHDKDFGELAFRVGLPSDCGVILLRLSGDSPEQDNQRAIGALEDRTDWEGNFTVVTDDRIRMRPLPRRGRRP